MIAHWLWQRFDLLASATSVKFYELRRNIQRPILVCARHFAIKCFDSRSILTMRKGTLNVCVLKGDRLNGHDDREEVRPGSDAAPLMCRT